LIVPISLAHTVHEKKDPYSDYEKMLARAGGLAQEVLACPYGCGRDDQDEFGHCDHLLGFTNEKLPDGECRNPPATAKVEVLELDRDKTQRRIMKGRVEPLKAGDQLIRVNGTSRRVYRQVTLPATVKKTEAPLG
jgi:hypothetical protein